MIFRSLVRQFLIWGQRVRRPDFVAKRIATHPAPEKLKPGLMLVVGTPNLQKWGCFQCPGGCGEIIKLSLNPHRRPCWAITIDGLGRPSISPSVRQLTDCHCHFWIKEGSVEWCADSPRPID
jgi:hypothetical protein